jgi:GNAT superfamily N-acetyltransferase
MGHSERLHDVGTIAIRRASQSDLCELLSLYEELAGTKTTAAPGNLASAEPTLAEILSDRRRTLVVAAQDSQLVGTADLLVVPNLTHRGDPWAIVENVIVAHTARRTGVGRALIEHLIGLARAAGCYKLQLVSGRQRAQAHAFYRSLGLEAVAEGFKIYFDE